jgi:hypothetical protein
MPVSAMIDFLISLIYDDFNGMRQLSKYQLEYNEKMNNIDRIEIMTLIVLVEGLVRLGNILSTTCRKSNGEVRRIALKSCLFNESRSHTKSLNFPC